MENENKNIKIHILHCGTINIHERFDYIKGNKLGRRVKLPVSAYLIEHPVHGNILVDTGLSADCREIMPKYLRTFLDPHVEKGQTAVEQLAAMGFKPEDIDVVMTTHNDVDHTCALRDFAGKAKRLVMGEHEFFWSCRYVYKVRQVWDTFIQFKDITDRPCFYGCALGPLGRGFDLFGDDSVLCVACPGHTDGQFAVMINKAPSGRFANAGNGIYGGKYVILASDAAFSQRNIDDMVIPGYGFDRNRQLNAIKWLKKMQDDPNCVELVCSHDPEIVPHTIEF